MWRNRYTRTFEGRVEKSLGVQVPPSTYKKDIDLCQYLFYYEVVVGLDIGFQDSLDAFLLATMPSCWEIKAVLDF